MFKPPEQRGHGESIVEKNPPTTNNFTNLSSVTLRLREIDTESKKITLEATELRTRAKTPQVLGELRALTAIQLDLIKEETLLLAKQRDLSQAGDKKYTQSVNDVWSQHMVPETKGASTTNVGRFEPVTKGETLGKPGEQFNWRDVHGVDDKHA